MHPDVLQAILNAPYLLAPRFDAGIHIRAQRSVLERGASKNLTQFEIEMANYRVVFGHFANEISRYLFEGTFPRFNVSHSMITGLWPRVFISCDDVDVRDNFVTYLRENSSNFVGQLQLSFVNASAIKLMGHLQRDKKSPDFQVIVDTAFDWYSLSLSNACFGWRKKYSRMTSTFMQSASRVGLYRRTAKDFKSKILASSTGYWETSYDYIDNKNLTSKWR